MHGRPSPLVVSLILVLVVACTADDAPAPLTEAEYVAELDAICAATTADLAVLPTPPEQISVADFASSAAIALASEADELRRLDPPSGLDDDHRALVLNTDDQAAAWRQVADDASAGATSFDTQRIGELTLGRNDLVTDLGADECVRDGL